MIRKVLLLCVLPCISTAYGIMPEVTAFTCSDNDSVMYIGLQNGGVWKTTDSCRNWESIDSELVDSDCSIYRVLDLYSVDTDCDTVIAEVNFIPPRRFNFVITTDGGSSWRALSPSEGGGSYGYHLIIDRDNHSHLILLTTGYMYVSYDFGLTWDQHIYDTHFNQKFGFLQDNTDLNTYYICGAPSNNDAYPALYIYKSFMECNSIHFFNSDSTRFYFPRDMHLTDGGQFFILAPMSYSDTQFNGISWNSRIFYSDDLTSWNSIPISSSKLFKPWKIVGNDVDRLLYIIYSPFETRSPGILRFNYDLDPDPLDKEGLDNSIVASDYNIKNVSINDSITYFMSPKYGIIKYNSNIYSLMNMNYPMSRSMQYTIEDDCFLARGSKDQTCYFGKVENNRISVQCIKDTLIQSKSRLLLPVLTKDDAYYSVVELYSDNNTYWQVVKSANGYDSWHVSGDRLYQAENYYRDHNYPMIYKSSTSTRILFIRKTDRDKFVVSLSLDYGESWKSILELATHPKLVQSDEYIIIAYNDSIYYTKDNGVTWNSIKVHVEDIQSKAITFCSICNDLIVTTESTIIRFNINSQEWKQTKAQEGQIPQSLHEFHVGKETALIKTTRSEDKSDPRLLVYISTDHGTIWKKVKITNKDQIYNKSLSPSLLSIEKPLSINKIYCNTPFGPAILSLVNESIIMDPQAELTILKLAECESTRIHNSSF